MPCIFLWKYLNKLLLLLKTAREKTSGNQVWHQRVSDFVLGLEAFRPVLVASVVPLAKTESREV